MKPQPRERPRLRLHLWRPGGPAAIPRAREPACRAGYGHAGDGVSLGAHRVPTAYRHAGPPGPPGPPTPPARPASFQKQEGPAQLYRATRGPRGAAGRPPMVRRPGAAIATAELAAAPYASRTTTRCSLRGALAHSPRPVVPLKIHEPRARRAAPPLRGPGTLSPIVFNKPPRGRRTASQLGTNRAKDDRPPPGPPNQFSTHTAPSRATQSATQCH